MNEERTPPAEQGTLSQRTLFIAKRSTAEQGTLSQRTLFIAKRSSAEQGTLSRRTLFTQRLVSRFAVLGTILAALLPCASRGEDSAKIVIEASSAAKKQPRLYTAEAASQIQVDGQHIRHEIGLSLRTLQGGEGPFSVELAGDAEVAQVQGEKILSWAARREGPVRYLEILASPEVSAIDAVIQLRSPKHQLPCRVSLSHLRPGKAASFSDVLAIAYAPGVAGKIAESKGFVSLSDPETNRFQTTTGGSLVIDLSADGSLPPPASLSNARLEGVVDPATESVAFHLTGVAEVAEAGATLDLLSGMAALAGPVAGADYAMRLENQIYGLWFREAGKFPVDLQFSARLERKAGEQSIDFLLRSEGVMPVSFANLEEKVIFTRGNMVFHNGAWRGFLPADGKVSLAWKPSAKSGAGKVFFSTSAVVETRVGAGLCQQRHDIASRILQGKLRQLSFHIAGEGEVAAVTGTHLLSWKVDGEHLVVGLNEEIDRETQVSIVTRTALPALPARLAPPRVEPLGTIRHSGMLRLSNEGSVRVESYGLSGLTQVSPDKFPGEPLEARQVSVFRFPAANYQFEVSADRIQPKIHVSEIARHFFSEGERTLDSTIELDIQDAPIRDWDLRVPADYAVVSVTGADVTDYLLATEAEDGARNLKIIFSGDLSGRRLLRLVLEKNEVTEAGNWAPPKLLFPGAESVRGDLGLAAAPGLRIAMASSTGLSERPLASFPGDGSALQHSFRLRDANWTAQAILTKLDKSIQADVFHLYSLSEGSAHGCVLLNYLITGAPVTEFQLQIPPELENVAAEGKDLRSQKVENGILTVTLHQAVMGAFTLLVTFEEKASQNLAPGRVAPLGIQSESGYIQLTASGQIAVREEKATDGLLRLDHLELPPEFRLLSAWPSLGVWQYNERPFAVTVDLHWMEPDRVLDQVVEFADVATLISRGEEEVTDLVYYVKSRDSRPFSLKLPTGTNIWDVRANGQIVAPRISGEFTQVPLELSRDGGLVTEVRMRLGGRVEKGVLRLPAVAVPVLKTAWDVTGDNNQMIVLRDDSHLAAKPVLPPSGMRWVEQRGLLALGGMAMLTLAGLASGRGNRAMRWLAKLAFLGASALGFGMAFSAWHLRPSPESLRIHLPVLSAGEEVTAAVRGIPLDGMAISGRGLFFLALAAAALVAGLWRREWGKYGLCLGLILAAWGLLSFSNSASLFYGLAATGILARFLMPGWRGLWKNPNAASWSADGEKGTTLG